MLILKEVLPIRGQINNVSQFCRRLYASLCSLQCNANFKLSLNEHLLWLHKTSRQFVAISGIILYVYYLSPANYSKIISFLLCSFYVWLCVIAPHNWTIIILMFTLVLYSKALAPMSSQWCKTRSVLRTVGAVTQRIIYPVLSMVPQSLQTNPLSAWVH